MKEIPLTLGMVALVDDEDFEYISQWKWQALKGHTTYYATRRFRLPGDRKGHSIQMHRFMTQADEFHDVDHEDHNGLNNQRYNLRVCTQIQNGQNRRIGSNNTSGYKGVIFEKALGKWRTRLQVDGKLLTVGYFTDLIEAAKAYDEAALEYFGEFACINFKL